METASLRARKLIDDVISHQQLDLSGLTVLTEVGSANYKYLPLIASLANAKKVFAWTKDSNYGTAADIIQESKIIMNAFHIDENAIEFSANNKSIDHLQNADIITNSANLRPLNSELLQHIKKDCVIPLMFEKWEIRDSDIDIEFCKKNHIKIAGTWENHPDLLVFNSVGNLAMKMAFNSGIEVWQNNIFVWSNDHFGKVIRDAFRNASAANVILSTDKNEFEKQLSKLDLLFLCDYEFSGNYFSKDSTSLFDIQKIKSENPSLNIVHLFGNVDSQLLIENEISVYPAKQGAYQRMSQTLDYIGPKTTFSLYAAGLKVATEMISGNYTSLSQQIIS